MKIHQLSLFLENRAGQLRHPVQLLAQAGIDIRTLMLADTQQFGILRLVVQDWQRAKQVLEGGGVVVNITEVVAIEVADRPGGLDEILALVEGAGMNVEYMYAFAAGTGGERAVMIDRSGRFWLMGGGSSGSSPYNKYYCAYYNDLWSVNPCTCNWAWLKGVTVSTGALGVYGTQGVPALANAPSARGGAACWTGKDGRLWLYGGNGNTSQAGPDPLADLWVLSVPTGIENEQWRQYQ